MRLLEGGEVDVALEDRHRPAGEVDVEILADVDLELAAVEAHGHRGVAAAQDVGDRGAARAGPAGLGLPHAALEDPRTDRGRVDLRVPRDVRAARELRVALDRRPDSLEVERGELVGARDAEDGLRVANRQVLEAR